MATLSPRNAQYPAIAYNRASFLTPGMKLWGHEHRIIFCSLVSLANNMNRYCQKRPIGGPRVSKNLALSCYFCSPIPILTLVALIPSVVILIILLKQLDNISVTILQHFVANEPAIISESTKWQSH